MRLELSQGEIRAHALTRKAIPVRFADELHKRWFVWEKEEMKDIHNPWDTLMKLLMGKGAQAFASLALPGVEVGDALDKELKIKNLRGDFFCNAYLNGLKIILHFEFQKKKHKKMDRRMWEYNAAMDINSGKPVYSILVYLTPKGNLVESPYVQEIPGTGMGHHFAFQVIKLWEIPPEVIKQSGFEELLPLLPLTKGGQNLETVDDMISELIARDRSDLLELGHLCAGLVFDDEIGKRWLKERFTDTPLNESRGFFLHPKSLPSVLAVQTVEVPCPEAFCELNRSPPHLFPSAPRYSKRTQSDRQSAR